MSKSPVTENLLFLLFPLETWINFANIRDPGQIWWATLLYITIFWTPQIRLLSLPSSGLLGPISVHKSILFP